MVGENFGIEATKEVLGGFASIAEKFIDAIKSPTVIISWGCVATVGVAGAYYCINRYCDSKEYAVRETVALEREKFPLEVRKIELKEARIRHEAMILEKFEMGITWLGSNGFFQPPNRQQDSICINSGPSTSNQQGLIELE